MIQILFFFDYEFCSFSVKFEFYIYVSDATRDFGRGLCVKYFDIPSKWRIRLTERLMGDMFLRIFFFFFFVFLPMMNFAVILWLNLLNYLLGV